MTLFLSLIIAFAQLPAGAQKPAPPEPGAGGVEIVLFSDFKCPFCANFARVFRELQSKGVAGVRTTVRFKHFPLEMHPAARLTHQAALAAGEQGKFWEMHDLLFANRSEVTRDDLVRYAARLGLNADRFQKDLDSDRLKQRVEADRAEGEKLGVQGTPTFFINGRAYSGTRSLEELAQLIRGERRRIQAMSEVADSRLSSGPATAPVTVEFFADLQSPVTRPAVAVLDEVQRKYPSKVRVQFRNFPLSFHPQAPLAHEAAMTAAAEGRFWEFARYILEHQDALREQELIAHAGRLGLDEVKFAALLGEHRYAARVDADLEAGLRRGLRGSPVMLVNGNRIDGVPTLERLTEFVEAELAAAHK
jgi:protein-disulfide isomerase